VFVGVTEVSFDDVLIDSYRKDNTFYVNAILDDHDGNPVTVD
jgi:hypothetical protein